MTDTGRMIEDEPHPYEPSDDVGAMSPCRICRRAPVAPVHLPLAITTEELREVTMPTIQVSVDFNELHERLDEPKVWEVLGKLKDLFG